MKMLPAAASAALLLLISRTSSADFIDDEWKWMIQRDFKEGCVTQLHQYLVTSGFNGSRSGAWLVESCEGLFEYGSSYHTDAALPASERLSVKRLRKLPPMPPEQIKKIYF